MHFSMHSILLETSWTMTQRIILLLILLIFCVPKTLQFNGQQPYQYTSNCASKRCSSGRQDVWSYSKLHFSQLFNIYNKNDYKKTDNEYRAETNDDDNGSEFDEFSKVKQQKGCFKHFQTGNENIADVRNILLRQLQAFCASKQYHQQQQQQQQQRQHQEKKSAKPQQEFKESWLQHKGNQYFSMKTKAIRQHKTSEVFRKIFKNKDFTYAPPWDKEDFWNLNENSYERNNFKEQSRSNINNYFNDIGNIRFGTKMHFMPVAKLLQINDIQGIPTKLFNFVYPSNVDDGIDSKYYKNENYNVSSNREREEDGNRIFPSSERIAASSRIIRGFKQNPMEEFQIWKREKLHGKSTTFWPSISAGAIANLGDFFRDLSQNVYFNEKSELGEGETRLLDGEHPLRVLHEEMKTTNQEDRSRNGKTARFLQALRTYRPSQKIRSLVSLTPHGYHGSNFNDPNYMWVGLG